MYANFSQTGHWYELNRKIWNSFIFIHLWGGDKFHEQFHEHSMAAPIFANWLRQCWTLMRCLRSRRVLVINNMRRSGRLPNALKSINHRLDCDLAWRAGNFEELCCLIRVSNLYGAMQNSILFWTYFNFVLAFKMDSGFILARFEMFKSDQFIRELWHFFYNF